MLTEVIMGIAKALVTWVLVVPYYEVSANSRRRCFAAVIQARRGSSCSTTPEPSCVVCITWSFSSNTMVSGASSKGSSNEVGSVISSELFHIRLAVGHKSDCQPHPSNIPKDMEDGLRSIFKGNCVFREQVVRPEISSNVACGSVAGRNFPSITTSETNWGTHCSSEQRPSPSKSRRTRFRRN